MARELRSTHAVGISGGLMTVITVNSGTVPDMANMRRSFSRSLGSAAGLTLLFAATCVAAP
ncbi:MAG: hypothetical protein HOQ24_18245, partial [Mycobacteriaceae bacterium]|nr:hypothetical protein [Mycobacteriaceae bacterium]